MMHMMAMNTFAALVIMINNYRTKIKEPSKT
jgi:hypothetical protein